MNKTNSSSFLNGSRLQWLAPNLPTVAAVLALAAFAQMVGLAQAVEYTTEYVPLRAQTYGLLYTPTTMGPNASVGLISMHPNGSRLTSLACIEFAKRGFRALCIAGQYVNSSREDMIWERLPLDVKPAVAYLRQLPGLESVLLLGGSGGGPLMSFYQNVAENGVKACQVPGRIGQCTDELADLPAADGVILRDPHFGYGSILLSMLDPSVVDEASPADINRSLDMFDPNNGYDPEGATYSEDFKRRYFRAQADRMDRLTQMALERLEKIEKGEGDYPDDEPFVIGRVQARIWQTDLSLVSRTKRAHPVVKPDGSVKVEIAHSVRVPGLSPERNEIFSGAQVNSVKAFLSTHAIRTTSEYFITEDDIVGIDWNSSNTATPANLEGVHVPILIMGMTGYYWMVATEIFYDHAASRDKTLIFIEGAEHGVTPCRACESTPGEFGDTVKNAFDYAADWIGDRFIR
jgi:hypothetical protein